MTSIYRHILILLFVAASYVAAAGQYRLVNVEPNSEAWPRWELHPKSSNPSTARIPLDTCYWELGRHPLFAVSENTLIGFNLSPMLAGPGAVRHWDLYFAAYAIEDGRLRVTESCGYQIPNFKSKRYRDLYDLEVDETVFTLIYEPFSKYGGAIRYDCRYYEPGDLPKLYKRFIRMVKDCVKVNPDHKPINYLDEI